MYIIKFFNGGKPYWLTGGSGGDPARTLCAGSAKKFKTEKLAERFRAKIIMENQHRYRGLKIEFLSEIENMELIKYF
jgi:hypothetical protein